MYKDRIDLYKELEKSRDSKLLVYITGDRPGLETRIHNEVYDFFVNHLDKMGVVPKISLYLYTLGGNTLAAWSIVNLIKLFCDELEVIIPSKARSAGTLLCLGAQTIVMTKQATLGPIDPSVNNPLNPQIPGSPNPNARFPVSVEAISGFVELAKNELNISGAENLISVLKFIADKIHPLVLGEVYRAKSQIKMLAEKLIEKQVQDEDKRETIISFLCSESGSHDYTINRREAANSLGLPIEKPDDKLYNLIKNIYNNIESELKLSSKFDPKLLLGANPTINYSEKSALIESIDGGCNYHCTEGRVLKTKLPAGIKPPPGMPPGAEVINDQRSYQGWRYENA